MPSSQNKSGSQTQHMALTQAQGTSSPQAAMRSSAAKMTWQHSAAKSECVLLLANSHLRLLKHCLPRHIEVFSCKLQLNKQCSKFLLSLSLAKTFQRKNCAIDLGSCAATVAAPSEIEMDPHCSQIGMFEKCSCSQ